METLYAEIGKKKSFAFGKDVYLLGEDISGVKYWLESAKWDCGWYWGFGYIKTYTQNNSPETSRDISSHQHAGDFMEWCIEWNSKKPTLSKTTFSNSEAWRLCELFKRFNLFRDLAEYYHSGGCGVTSLKDNKKDLEEHKRINEVVIPEIMNEIIRILNP